MLFKLWQNALLDQPASSSEIWRWVHSVYGDELGLTSEDDADYICPTRITLSSLNDNSPPLSLNCGTISPRYFALHPKDQNGSEKYGEESSSSKYSNRRNGTNLKSQMNKSEEIT